ncbi:MAG: CRTAC1 family protein [Planctomycetota bacterium]|jgi:hypothetical protein
MRLAIALVLVVICGCSGSNPSRMLDTSTGTEESKTHGAVAYRIAFELVDDALPGSAFLDGSEAETFSLPETTGGGSAIFDFDSDGRCDVCCSSGGSIDLENRQVRGREGSLFRGLGAFRFQRAAALARIDMSRIYSSAVLAADFDSDGFVDLAFAGFANFLLFRNMGDGTFEAVPDIPGESGSWSSGAAFFDADRDGDLDLYIVHYADWSFDNHPFCPSRADASQRDYCGPTDFSGLRDSFYVNEGDGSWRDASETMTAGIARRGLGVLAADLDGDGDTDVYVANDVEPNLLFRNEQANRPGEMGWREVGVRSGAATNDYGRPEGSMGIALGDCDNDGRFDLWVTNYEDEINSLYRNTGNLNFSYASHAARIAPTDEKTVGWGTAFLDADLDGDEDLLVINGHLERYASYRLQRPQVLENIDGRSFQLSKGAGLFFETPQAGRGLSIADFDFDGRLDCCVTRVGSEHAMLRNTTRPSGSYLRVQLIGTASNRDAIGTVAVLSFEDQSRYRQVYGGGSYASTSERTLHFGIPSSVSDSRATLTVQWPSGIRQEVPISRWNQTIHVIEGDGIQ